MKSEKDRALDLAKLLNVVIPQDIPMSFWSLPILEAIANRIQALRLAVDDTTERVSELEGSAKPSEEKQFGGY